jgi:hypothetical protein
VRRITLVLACVAAWACLAPPSRGQEKAPLQAVSAPTAVERKTIAAVSGRSPLADNPNFLDEKRARLTDQLLNPSRRHHLLTQMPPVMRPPVPDEIYPPGALPAATEVRAEAAVVMQENVPLTGGAVGPRSTILEPTVAVTKRNEILYTGNWFAATSRNGPGNLALADPYTTFPSNQFTFCCDQVAIYSAKHDLLIWYLQYVTRADGNIMRIAVATKEDIAAGTWSFYDFRPTDLGGAAWANTWFDYPDMAVTDKYLHITTNSFTTNGTAPIGDDGWGRAIALRIPLDDLKNRAQTVTPQVFSNASSGSWRLTQGATGTMYFGGHDPTNHGGRVEIYGWADDQTNLTRSSVNVQTWSAGQAYFSGNKDGTAWLTSSRTDPRLTAGWVQGTEVGFAWTAARGNGFDQPHVRVVIADVATPGLGKPAVAQPHVYNATYAFATPAAAVSADGKHVALNVSYGGGRTIAGGTGIRNVGQAVGLLKKEPTGYSWVLTNVREGTNGPNSSQWGDYTSVRADPRFKNGFVASGWTMEGGRELEHVTPRYVRFTAGPEEAIDKVDEKKDPDKKDPPPKDNTKAELLVQIAELEKMIAALKLKVESLPSPPPPATAPRPTEKPYK